MNQDQEQGTTLGPVEHLHLGNAVSGVQELFADV
jgi:hypothetical protein